MTRGIWFAGGGANGAASAAQSLRLQKMGRSWSLWGGESIGACNAYLGALWGPAWLVGVWQHEIRHDAVYRGGGWLAKVATLAGARRGIYDMTPARETLERLAAGRHLAAGTRVLVTRTDLEYGCRRDDILTADTLPASCAEMVYQSCLVPVAHGARDGRWADGGVSSTAPLGPLIRAGADSIDVILLDRLGTASWPPGGNALDEAGRAIAILRENLFAADLELAYRINLAPLVKERHIEITLWEPVDSLPGWMDWSPEATVQRLACRFKPWTLSEAVEEIRRRRVMALALSVANGREEIRR